MQKNQKVVKRQRRIFSESIRKQTVKDIEEGKCTVKQACNELLVSDVSVYRWIEKYSRYLKKNKVLIVEDKSEAYRTKELERKIKELEAALGRKTLESEYFQGLIDIASKELSIDIKKNFAEKTLTNSKKKGHIK